MPKRTWSAGSVGRQSPTTKENNQKIEIRDQQEEERIRLYLGKGGYVPLCPRCSVRLQFEAVSGDMRLYCLNGHEIKVLRKSGDYIWVAKHTLKGR